MLINFFSYISKQKGIQRLGTDQLDKMIGEENLQEIVKRAATVTKKSRTKGAQKSTEKKYTKGQQQLLPKKKVSEERKGNEKEERKGAFAKEEIEEEKQALQALKSRTEKSQVGKRRVRRDLLIGSSPSPSSPSPSSLTKVSILEATPPPKLSSSPKPQNLPSTLVTHSTVESVAGGAKALSLPQPFLHATVVSTSAQVEKPLKPETIVVLQKPASLVLVESTSFTSSTSSTSSTFTSSTSSPSSYSKQQTESGREEEGEQVRGEEGRGEEVGVTCIDIVDQGLVDLKLCEELRKLPLHQPLSLAFGGNDMQAEGARVLGELLEKGQVIIKTLQLQWNLLSSEGAAMLLTGLLHSSHLTLLDLVSSLLFLF